MTSRLPAPDPKHIANFARLETWLARGDQPDSAGYKWLAEQGIRTVVNFRMRNKEKKVTKATGTLESVHIPVKNDRPPRDQQAVEFLELCRRNAPDRPMYVHCKGGQGRTSTFCALARLAQGWPIDEAIAEEQKFGFRPGGEHKKQAQFLYDFFKRVQAGLLEIPRLP